MRRRFEADLDPDNVRFLLRDGADALDQLEAELEQERALLLRFRNDELTPDDMERLGVVER